MNSQNVLLVSDCEHATILNALRFWQAAGRPTYPEYFEEVPAPVSEENLDAFIERINVDVNLSVLLTVEKGIITSAYVPGASDRICLNVFDMDIDGADEDQLDELSLPFAGIQSGTTYSVARNIDAPEFLNLLDTKWQLDALEGQYDPVALHYENQRDMFASADPASPAEEDVESAPESESEHADA